MFHSILMVCCAIFCLSESDAFENKFKLPELSAGLREHIGRISSQAAAEFNNIVDIDFSAFERSNNLQGATIDNAFLEIPDEKFLLTDLQIVEFSAPRFLRLVPDFFNGFMDSAVSWNNVVVEGSFEKYQRFVASNLELSDGKLRITWKRIDGRGKIAFLPSKDSAGFYSSNYDLEITSGCDVEIMFIAENGENSKVISIDSNKFGSYLQEDVVWKLQNSLPLSVDLFLGNLSVPKLFQNNELAIAEYRQYQDIYNEIINNFMDEIIRMVQEGVKESGFWKFVIPDIKEEFSKKFGFIRFWGHLTLWNGQCEDVRTLKRRNSFSLIVNNGTFDIAGELSVGKLSIGYGNYQAKIWDIGPSGSVLATVKNNAISFKLRAVDDKRSKIGYRISSYSIKAHIDSISVTATGLGIFDWLLSLIVTVVVNILKGDISAIIENGAGEAIEKLIHMIS